MSRFVIGDDLGNLKILHYSDSKATKTEISNLQRQETSSSARGVQKLATHSFEGQLLLSTAFSDGNCSLSILNEDDTLGSAAQWKEMRIAENKFIGMTTTGDATFTCTSNGMLRKTSYTLEGEEMRIQADPEYASLPSRLADWRLSPTGENFAYGGEEVDLSVWDSQRAFQGSQPKPTSKDPSGSKKRKRNDDLFPAEVWRARNIPNDHLGLRQPVRITTLTYLDCAPAGQQLVTGTQFGDLRRYDTRARRPVSNWTGLGKVGGVKVIEKGLSEHQLFMGDAGSNLYAIDLRTGGILHGYKGISGAITSIAISGNVMVSTALDRFARVHSLVAPPVKAGAHQDQKPEVLEKCYLNTAPSVIIWDKREAKPRNQSKDEEDNDDEDVWNKLENIS